jgi:tetratricopeptide (TPR) repeat protein
MICVVLALVLSSLLYAQEQTAPTRDINLSRDEPQRNALLIGNAAYLKSPLRNPIHDVTDLRNALETLRFNVRVVTDADREGIRSAISSFADGLHEGDEALFYYAGHGLQVNYENYLVPVDFVPVREESLPEVCFPFQEAKRRLESSRAGVLILIMDACRNNPFNKGQLERHGLAAVEAGLGSYIVFSAAPGQTASDNPEERNGLFAKYLLEALHSPLNISDLFRRVRQDVYVASGHNQLPYLHDQVLWPFFFVRLEPSLQEPQRVSRTSRELLEAGRLAYHSGNCEEAYKLFDQASRQDADSSLAHHAAGASLACMGHNAQAVVRFNEALAIQPDLAIAYMSRGIVYLHSGRYSQAIRDFSWTIQQDPVNGAAYWRRGHAAAKLRRYEDALADFSRAIELNDADPNPFFGRGMVRHRLGKDREALDDLNAAISRRASFGEAYWQRARVRRRLGDTSGAEADERMAENLGVRDWLIR